MSLSLLHEAVDHGLLASDALEIGRDPDLKLLHDEPRFNTLVSYARQRAGAAERSSNQERDEKGTS